MLIPIDLQKAVEHSSWGERNNPGAAANVARLPAVWRTRGWPVYHVRHDSKEPDVRLVEDATFTFARRDWQGRARTADEVHAMSPANLHGEYCTVVTADEVLREAEA